MSFIFQDKNFLNLLYKMAQETESAARLAPLSEDLVNKIFDNIKQQKESSKFKSITGKEVKDRASETEAAFDQPSVKDLSNLDVFLGFCRRAGVKVSDKDIVIDYSETTPQGDGWKPYPAQSPKFYVNVPGLSLYLEFLKSSEDYKTNRVYIYMLGELIRDAKSAFGIEVSTLEDTVIANLNKQIDIAKTLGENNGNIQLKLGDLRDFPAWYKKNGISVISQGGGIQPEKDAQCALLKYLHEKLENPEHRSSIKACAGNLGCPISNWTVSTTPQPSQPQSPTAPGVAAPSSSAALSQSGKVALDNLIRILKGGGPFYYDRVFIGRGRSDRSTASLVSFCNNCEIYFESMKEASSDPGAKQNFNILASDSVEAGDFVWNLYQASQAYELRRAQRTSVYNVDQSNLNFLFRNGVVGMDGTLNLIRAVDELNNLGVFNAQQINHAESRHTVESVRLANLIQSGGRR